MVDGLHRMLALASCSGFNLKYDMQACASDPLVGPIAKIRSDARIKRKLHEADAEGSLDVCAHLVGLGGHKKEAEQVVDAIVAELSKLSVAQELTPAGKARKPPVCVFVDPTQLQNDELALIRSGISEKSFAYRWIPDETLWRYVARDVFATMEVDHWADARLGDGPKRVWNDVSLPAIQALAIMESNGLPIDVPMLDALGLYFERRVAEALATAHVHAPGLNPNSPQQVITALKANGIFLKEKHGKVSTDETSLAPFREKSQLVHAILEYRRLVKLHKTYAVGLRRAVRGDRRVHSSFLLDGAETGRVSSADPNCFSCDTEVLTPDGWVRFDALREDVQVAQWSPSTLPFGQGSVAFVSPTGRIARFHTGDSLVCLENDHIDLVATRDHRCLLRHRKTGAYKVFPAAEYPEDWQQVHAGLYDAHSPVAVAPAMIVLLCATQADGSYTPTGLDFGFVKRRKYDRLVEALDALGADYSVSQNGRRLRIYVRQSALVAEVKALLGAEKVFGPWLLGWCRADLVRFCSEVMLWDGCATRMNHYASTKKTNCDWVQTALALTGQRATVRTQTYSYRSDRFIHIVNVTPRDYSMTTNVRRGSVEPPGGKVYCVEVPSGYILVRRGGKVCVVGNCQNIPRNKDDEGNLDGKLIRDCICAPEGRTLVEADFSQLEIRMAAYLSQDQVMIALLNTGIDFHTQAAELMGIDRSSAKTTVFAVLYELPEMLGYLVSKRLKVSAKRGNEIADLMFGQFKRLKEWMLECLSLAGERGGMVTRWGGLEGRYRPLWHLASYQEFRKGQHDNAKRSTWNGEVQGTAAECATSSLWPIVCALRAEVPTAKLVLTVHDSIMVECDEGDEVLVAKILRRVMLRFDLGNVPLAVEIKKGRRWGSMEVMEPSTYA